MKYWVVGLVVVAACGGSAASKPDAAIDAAVDVPPDVATRTVTGSFVVHWLAPSGQTDTPIDLSHAPIQVLIPPSFAPISGTGNADGTFTIPNVPVGDFIFVAGARYLVMSGDTLDLGEYVDGRSANSIATAPTNLTFNVTGLAAWQSVDELELYSPSSGTLAFDLEAYATSGAPMVNDTSLTNLLFDLERSDRGALLSAAAGDTATLAQLSAQTDGTHSYTSISRTYTPAPFTIDNGGSASLMGAFTTVAPSQTLAMTLDRPAFAAEVNAHYTSTASQNWSTFAITALQGATTHGFYNDGPDVLVYAPGYSTDSTAITASWPYGDPFPADWGRIAWTRYMKYRLIQLPGGSATAAFGSLFTYVDLASLTTQSTIEPGIGMVVNPKINSADALTTTTLTGITTTPTLSWDPPTLGTAAKYYVDVRTVTVRSGATTLQTIAVLETPHTQLTIPPGVVLAGQTYVFEIVARASNLDLEATPSLLTLPDARSVVTTAMATP